MQKVEREVFQFYRWKSISGRHHFLFISYTELDVVAILTFIGMILNDNVVPHASQSKRLFSHLVILPVLHPLTLFWLINCSNLYCISLITQSKNYNLLHFMSFIISISFILGFLCWSLLLRQDFLTFYDISNILLYSSLCLAILCHTVELRIHSIIEYTFSKSILCLCSTLHSMS